MLTGLHHITAIAGDARRNLAFYTDTLGLRLVKRTVNFGDPFTWRLCYGNEVGRRGMLITHFPHARCPGPSRDRRDPAEHAARAGARVMMGSARRPRRWRRAGP